MKTEYIKNNLESVKEFLNNSNTDTLVAFHNQYCQNCNYSDNEIFTNDDEFFNTFFEGRVIEAVRAVAYGEYNYSHEYVQFDGYGNLISFNDPETYIDIEEIAQNILDEPGDYYGIELEEEEEEEEEEE